MRAGIGHLAVVGLAMVASLAPCASGEPWSWSRLLDLPAPMTNNAVASVANADGTVTIYSFGGITDPVTASNALPAAFAITLPGGTWDPIADVPLLNNKPKVGASAVSVAGEVYLVGGYTLGRFETTEHRLFRYDPDTDTYAELARVPVEVDDTVPGVYLDRYIVLMSGWHGPINNNVTDVQVYDTLTDAWVQSTPIPAPGTGLFGHAGGVSGRTLLCIDGTQVAGGFTISGSVLVGTMDPEETGDLTTIQWDTLPAHPGAPTYRAAATPTPLPDGRLMVVGGTDNPYNITGNGYDGVPAVPLEQVLLFDPADRSWQLIEDTSPRPALMDHRGLVRVGAGWAVVGGMPERSRATREVWLVIPERCADLTGDGRVDAADVNRFLDVYLGGAIEADFHADGRLDGRDVGEFLVRFTLPCG